ANRETDRRRRASFRRRFTVEPRHFGVDEALRIRWASECIDLRKRLYQRAEVFCVDGSVFREDVQRTIIIVSLFDIVLRLAGFLDQDRDSLGPILYVVEPVDGFA